MSTLFRRTLESNGKNVEILRTVPDEKGFHFNTAPGSFTGETATSLEDFEKKLQAAPAESISFHLQKRRLPKMDRRNNRRRRVS